MMNRRRFLKWGAAAPLVAGSWTMLGNPEALAGAGTSPAARRRAAGRAKNVIFLVSDGMSMGTLTAADQYRHWRDGHHSHWIGLYMDGDREVHRGVMDMSSRNSTVTDSAAASASWGGGHRMYSGRLNVDPDGRHHEPILVSARAAGKATALVTTTTVTHATPAGFAANVEHRNQQPRIAEQYLDRGIDVLLGGGSRHFDPEHREDERDLRADFAAEGYAVIDSRKQLLELDPAQKRVLGVFSGGHVPYEIDRLNDEELKQQVPSLAEMTRSALDRLSRHEDGFIMQVEGGRVDHAAHSNDLAGLVFDQLAFDDAVGVALAFQAEHPDTLVIVTTDHGNANPGFQSGNELGVPQFERISRFRGSSSAHIHRHLRQDSPDRIRERFKEVLDLTITEDEARMLHDWAQDEYRPPYRRMNRPGGMVGQIVANHLDFSWIGNAHTADYVELAGVGPGAEAIRPFVKNTELYTLTMAAMGIERTEGAARHRGEAATALT